MKLLDVNLLLYARDEAATLAIEHGAQLCSTDPDFSRFPGLRWVDPLR